MYARAGWEIRPDVVELKEEDRKAELSEKIRQKEISFNALCEEARIYPDLFCQFVNKILAELSDYIALHFDYVYVDKYSSLDEKIKILEFVQDLLIRHCALARESNQLDKYKDLPGLMLNNYSVIELLKEKHETTQRFVHGQGQYSARMHIPMRNETRDRDKIAVSSQNVQRK